MVINRETGDITENRFYDLPKYLEPDDVLVLNDAKVIPARLRARKDSGGKTEIFLLGKREPSVWNVLLKGNVREGANLHISELCANVLERLPDGSWLVKFNAENDNEILKHGEIPLPPYIKRLPEDTDYIYYQTVYANKAGAVAAPTAGLHFTKELLCRIQQAEVNVVSLTLYIGWASFRLLKKPEMSVPAESFEIPRETAECINKARTAGKKIYAVGTSTVRAIESASRNGLVEPCTGTTELFIQPGYTFQITDRLITNFHLPGSTHLRMVCAFAGPDLMRRAYEKAIREKFRFYSYGDSMLIL